MALDDVAIRAMSKLPEDRFPSAGDLGRAAQAALRGEKTTAPERTVATGAAATRVAMATQAEPRAERPETVATRRLAPKTTAEPRHRRRSLALAVGGLLAVAIAVMVPIVAGGGGGSSPSVASQDSNRPAPKRRSRPKPPPDALSESELIAKADAICEASQNAYRSVRSKVGEETPDVAYSVTLLGISTRGVERFKRLVPPPGLRADFKRYVRAQERVKRYDEEALKAAEAGGASAYLAARASRDDEEAERYELARAVGLEVCSPNR